MGLIILLIPKIVEVMNKFIQPKDCIKIVLWYVIYIRYF